MSEGGEIMKEKLLNVQDRAPVQAAEMKNNQQMDLLTKRCNKTQLDSKLLLSLVNRKDSLSSRQNE